MHQRKSLLNSKYKTAHIDAEGAINLLFRYGTKRSHLVPHASIGKDNANAPLLLCNLRVEPVKVFQVGDITLDGRDILSNFRNGNMELFLSPPSDVYIRPSPTNCSAVANPIPQLPPVMTAIFPASLFNCCSSWSTSHLSPGPPPLTRRRIEVPVQVHRPLDPVHGKAILRSVAGVLTNRPQNQFGIF